MRPLQLYQSHTTGPSNQNSQDPFYFCVSAFTPGPVAGSHTSSRREVFQTPSKFAAGVAQRLGRPAWQRAPVVLPEQAASVAPATDLAAQSATPGRPLATGPRRQPLSAQGRRLQARAAEQRSAPARRAEPRAAWSGSSTCCSTWRSSFFSSCCCCCCSACSSGSCGAGRAALPPPRRLAARGRVPAAAAVSRGSRPPPRR